MATMYSMKPHYTAPFDIELPDVMYKLPRTQGGETIVANSQIKQVSSELLSLKQRQDDLIAKLDNLLDETTAFESSAQANASSSLMDKQEGITDIVIHASPDRPPRSLKFIRRLLSKRHKVLWKVHKHSSLTAPSHLDSTWENENCLNRSSNDMVVTIIFKKVDRGPLVFVSPSMHVPMCGESNIARLFGRHLGLYDSGPTSADVTAKTDVILDACDIISSPATSHVEKMAAVQRWSQILNESSWLGGEEATLADAVALSTLRNSGLKVQCQKIKKWLHYGNDLV